MNEMLCNMCLHDPYCQHNLDYQCQEVIDFFERNKGGEKDGRDE